MRHLGLWIPLAFEFPFRGIRHLRTTISPLSPSATNDSSPARTAQFHSLHIAQARSTRRKPPTNSTMLPRPLLRCMFTLSVVFYAMHPVANAIEDNPCITPYGSPCGPIANCIVDKKNKKNSAGYRCEELYNKETCPVGCGPKEECKKNKATKIYSCECKNGFNRPKA